MIDRIHYPEAPSVMLSKTPTTSDLEDYLSEQRIVGEEILDLFKGYIVVSGKNFIELAGYLFEMHINLQIQRFMERTQLIDDVHIKPNTVSKNFRFFQNNHPARNIRAARHNSKTTYSEFDRVVRANQKDHGMPIIIEGTISNQDKALTNHNIRAGHLDQKFYPLVQLLDTNNFGYIFALLDSTRRIGKKVNTDLAEREIHVATVPTDKHEFLRWVDGVYTLLQMPYHRQ